MPMVNSYILKKNHDGTIGRAQSVMMRLCRSEACIARADREGKAVNTKPNNMHQSLMHSPRAEGPQTKAGFLRYGTLLSMALLFLLAACTTTEEIWINADGTVRRELRYDMSAMMSFANMMEESGEEGEEEETEWPMIAEWPYDTLDNEGHAEYEADEDFAEEYEDDLGYAEEDEDDEANSDEYETDEDFVEEYEDDIGDTEDQDGYSEWQEGEDLSGPQGFDLIFDDMMKRDKIDTLISFKAILLEMLEKEGVAEDEIWEQLAGDESLSKEEKMAAGMLINTMLNMHLRINSDKAEGIYQMSLIQDFDDIDGLNSVGDILSTLLTLGGDNLGEAAPLFDMLGQNPAYSMKKKEFRLLRPAEPEAADEEMTEEDLYAQMMQAFMQHEYIIHFPGKIKKVNLKDAKIEGNTVRISAPTGGEAASKPFELIVKYK